MAPLYLVVASPPLRPSIYWEGVGSEGDPFALVSRGSHDSDVYVYTPFRRASGASPPPPSESRAWLKELPCRTVLRALDRLGANINVTDAVCCVRQG